ncbi:hypothetical protein OK074_0900, partial [Actinobacteria bacterium OK074]
SVTVPNMSATSAYQMIITPATSASPADVPTRYEAEYAALSSSPPATYRPTNISRRSAASTPRRCPSPSRPHPSGSRPSSPRGRSRTAVSGFSS